AEHDIQGMIDGVANGSLFASASALSITSEREEIIDFTHPYFITGLGIAVSYKPTGFLESAKAIFSADLLWVLLLLAGLLFFWGLLVWLFERKENLDEFGGSAAEGIGSGFWWAAVTMTTVGYGDKSPRTLGGRVIGFIWMFTAIIVISFFTASIASSLTVTQLETRVSGPQDLPFVRVGALENSATLVYLEGKNIRSNTYETISAGLMAVENDQIDAFVHDAPIIRYYSQRDFRNKVRVLSDTFNEQYYGIVLPMNSEYRNEMNRIILDYIQSETWKNLNSVYLGD
ncbi:MAG: ion channel, partial [Balneolaceae bacterium]